MTIFNILYSSLIYPLQLLFEFFYLKVNNLIQNPGVSIIALSLAVNTLVLPLYKRADAIQKEENELEAKISEGVAHIKKTFKGDERMMMLNTYYRQNNYRPTDVFKGSISLLLQIPFFLAAYNFLSKLQLLQGVSFGPIRDLSAPDAMLTIGALSINLLPFVMTFVNLITSIIYSKGSPMKTKVQLYGMIAFFLVFLYRSPSGLVFYWTLNNVFSLVKTICYKIKNSQTYIYYGLFGVGAILFVVGEFIHPPKGLMQRGSIALLAIILMLPVLRKLFSKVTGGKEIKFIPRPKEIKNGYICGALFMVGLMGMAIPSSVIKASPQEFFDVYHYMHPNWFVVSCMAITVGFFLVWGNVFRSLMAGQNKAIFDLGIWLIAGVSLFDYLTIKYEFGVLSNALKYEKEFMPSMGIRLVNMALVMVLIVLLMVLFYKLPALISKALLFAGIALALLAGINMVQVNTSVQSVLKTNRTASEEPTFKLSKNGQNVIAIMLDRGMNEYIPYIMNEKPELLEAYSGFTYYENTLSFGAYTNFGSPVFFGGYEYTPEKMNTRKDESLKDKHNEAIRVLPVLFDRNGFEVTVFDPVYANYQNIPDLTVYDPYPNIAKYNLAGRFISLENKEFFLESNKRNFFYYSLMKCVPSIVQKHIYDQGNYNWSAAPDVEVFEGQTRESIYKSEGIDLKFEENFTVLEHLSSMTEISEGDENTFLIMTNTTTHEPQLLQEPEYVPAEVVDNTEYERDNQDRFTVNGKTLHMENTNQVIHYQSNMAAIIQIGKWLNYLKEQGVYDNTRIIIGSDHGRDTAQLDDMILNYPEMENFNDLEYFYPLLMVKDFGSTEFTTSDEFMTNGDVPTLACEGVIDNPVNPFSGKALNSEEKNAEVQYVFASPKFFIDTNHGNTFVPGKWYTVHDDVRDPNNWEMTEDPVK